MFRARFVAEFITITSFWEVLSGTCSWNSLHVVYGNILGKQTICIRIADAKRESFSVHSPHDTQSRSVIPPNYRGIKLWSDAV